MRSVIVSYSTNILVNVLTALIAFRLLRQLRFSVNETVLGVLALMFCTTHLHYTQNMQENNYIMLLTLSWIFLPVRVAAHGECAGAFLRLVLSWLEPVDSCDDWPRPDRGRRVPFANPLD